MLQLLGGRWERNLAAEQRICGRSHAQYVPDRRNNHQLKIFADMLQFFDKFAKHIDGNHSAI